MKLSWRHCGEARSDCQVRTVAAFVDKLGSYRTPAALATAGRGPLGYWRSPLTARTAAGPLQTPLLAFR